MKKFSVIVLLIMLSLFFGCQSSNERLAQKMIEKYSDPHNYVALSGVVVKSNNRHLEVKCEELKMYIHYEDDICEYYIHSDSSFDLKEGDIIEFVTVPFHFYNGHKLPIVELRSNGETLLSLECGKDNLIEWVNINFA